jgi:hypothetical protein
MGGFGVRYSPKDHTGSSYVDVTTIVRGGRFMR